MFDSMILALPLLHTIAPSILRIHAVAKQGPLTFHRQTTLNFSFKIPQTVLSGTTTFSELLLCQGPLEMICCSPYPWSSSRPP
jgi:hypothetical protein